jgi:hypothetical protein
MGFSVRIAPGVRVRASSRGVRASFGPRVARVHVGAGRTAFSTGAGPFTYHTSTGEARRQSSRSTSGGHQTATGASTVGSTSRATMTLAQAAKAQKTGRVQQAIDTIVSIHRQSFTPAEKPLSPPPPLVDAGAIRRQYVTAGTKGLSIFDWKARKAAKEQAAVEAEAAIQQEVDRLRQQFAQYQVELDSWWSRLLANEPEVVQHELAKAFEDNEAAAAPLGVSDSEATLVVLLPGEDAIPAKTPSITRAGNPSLKNMTKRDHDLFYNVLAAGYALVTIKEAFAVAPSVDSVRIVAVRAIGTDAYGAKKGEVLVAARIRRERLADVQWASVDAPTILADIADELVMNQKGAAKTLTPLDLTKEPELAQVVAAIDFDELDE